MSLSNQIKEESKQAANPKLEASFVLPVKGVLSQKFNASNHPAIDIVAKKDAIVKACLTGVILYCGFSKEDGYFTIIDHSNGFVSIYKHLKINLKKVGQRIQSGDSIGIVGNSGEDSTDPHLHFELWQNMKAVDPTVFVKVIR